ncbi:MAG TPA: hypothetical protein VNR89_11975 [Roseomonas sp.]|nr:hypothetical protein [Roseomonas sp.]
MSRKAAKASPKAVEKTLRKPQSGPKPRKAGKKAPAKKNRKAQKADPSGSIWEPLLLRIADYALGLALLGAGIWGLVAFRSVL